MTRNIARFSFLGVIVLGLGSGCVNLHTWRIDTFEAARKAEDGWGCLVDEVGHHSPIDQPWCDPHYVKGGIYRVAAPGTVDIYDHDPAPATYDGYDDLGDMKPPTLAPPSPSVPMPE